MNHTSGEKYNRNKELIAHLNHRKVKNSDNSFKNLMSLKKANLKTFINFDTNKTPEKIKNNSKSRSKPKIRSRSKKISMNDSGESVKKPKHYTARLKKDLIFEKEFLYKENIELTTQIEKKNEELNTLQQNYLKVNVSL